MALRVRCEQRVGTLATSQTATQKLQCGRLGMAGPILSLSNPAVHYVHRANDYDYDYPSHAGALFA